jgi:hypothetical protein
MSDYDPALNVAGTWEGDRRRLRELKRHFVKVCEQRNEAQAERDRLLAAITTALDLTSTYDAERGNHVFLISNLQARNILLGALEDEST